MSNVQALSRTTGGEFKQLSEKAKEMGASTSKSASESADALGYMALAGWDTSQMLTGIEPILRASEAGNMDLAKCSDLVTDSMSAMGIQVQDLNHYLDVCSKTQASSNTSLDGLLEAYVGCGGTLKNLNVSVEESATVLGTLANRGIKGAEAGTALNSIMVNLVGANKNAANAMSALGVSAWDSDGNFVGLSETLKRLNGALGNCTDEQKALFEAQIGGKTQMDTLQAMLSGVGEEYDDLNAKIMDCDGCLIDTAKTMQDNVPGAAVAFKSALEGLGISIYETFNGKLKDSIQLVTGYVSELSKGVQDGNIISTLNKIKLDIINNIIEAIKDIGTTISKNLSIFNEVILSIVDVINQTLPTFVDNVLPSVMQSLLSLVKAIVDELPSMTKNITDGAIKLFDGLLSGMQVVADKLVKRLPKIIQTLIPAITEKVPEFFKTGLDILTTLINGIVSAMPQIGPAMIKCAGEMMSSLITTITENLPTVVQTGLELLVSLLDGIVSALPQLVGTITDCVMLIVQMIVDNLPMILDSGIKILLAIIQGIVDKLPELIDAAVDLILTIVDTIVNNLDMIIDAALKIIIAVCRGLLENLDKIFEAVPQVVQAIVQAIIDNLDLIIQAAIEILVTIGATLIGSVGELIKYIPEVIDAIGNAFMNTDWAQIGRDILTSLFDGITEIGERAGDFLGGIGDKIIDGLGFHSDGTWSLPGFANGGSLTHGSALVGEVGPELLTVMGGRATVTPLSKVGNAAGTGAGIGSKTYNITNIVNVDKISNDYDINRIDEQLAFRQRQRLKAVGG